MNTYSEYHHIIQLWNINRPKKMINPTRIDQEMIAFQFFLKLENKKIIYSIKYDISNVY
jgi:hypothetical protein